MARSHDNIIQGLERLTGYLEDRIDQLDQDREAFLSSFHAGGEPFTDQIHELSHYLWIVEGALDILCDGGVEVEFTPDFDLPDEEEEDE